MNSNFGKSLEKDQLSVPKKKSLPKTNTELPMVIVADEAFPLKPYIMRPYPGKNLTNEKIIYNYRLSRARRVSENAFGILQQKFRVFTRRLQGKPENITNIILATCVLHNFIRKSEGNYVTEYAQNHNKSSENVDKLSKLHQLPRLRGRATDDAFAVREQFKCFLNSSEGSVDWQEQTAMAI